MSKQIPLERQLTALEQGDAVQIIHDLVAEAAQDGNDQGLVHYKARHFLTKLAAPDEDDELNGKYYQAAINEWQKEGEIEIDPNALVSISSDGGAYVQAWVWVSNEEAGIDEEEGDD